MTALIKLGLRPVFVEKLTSSFHFLKKQLISQLYLKRFQDLNFFDAKEPTNNTSPLKSVLKHQLPKCKTICINPFETV